MPIDTQNKRRSVTGIMPVPDGAMSAADRAQAAWMYSGMTYAALIRTVLHHYIAATRTWFVAAAARHFHRPATDQVYHRPL